MMYSVSGGPPSKPVNGDMWMTPDAVIYVWLDGHGAVPMATHKKPDNLPDEDMLEDLPWS